jgi:hypothetical protein
LLENSYDSEAEIDGFLVGARDFGELSQIAGDAQERDSATFFVALTPG